VERIEHLPPAQHRAFYNAQKVTLNITRSEMLQAGFSPSVRLFEAAACGVPIISDNWPGLDLFFELDTEILIAYSGCEIEACLNGLSSARRKQIGERARQRVLAKHTAIHRAQELEGYIYAFFSGTTGTVEALKTVQETAV